ncbi:High mobility group B protein 13 [Spatholobus suberectus]|nr:High mobility group B protein 13 [Spatholobus suberectus]
MGDTVAEVVATKRGRGRRALKEKTPSTNEANIIAGKVSESSATPISPPSDKGQVPSKKQDSKKQQSFEKELLEMQEMLQQLRLEKEKTEELLKAKDEALKQKEEELENRGREQEKLQTELKKLHKLKEFKPTMNLPVLKDNEQKKDKKKKGCSEKKRPSPPYILWMKDQWNEIKRTNPEAEFKEISNMLGAKWKTVSAEEKKPYEEKYHAEKEAYLQVMAKEKRESEAMKLLEEEQKQKTAMELLEQYMQFKQEAEKRARRTKKDPMKPKHPMSAYFLFTNDRRAALLSENKNFLEVPKITAEEWKNMTEGQRRPYEEMAKKNKEKYTLEMEAYKQKKEEEAAHLMKEEEEHMKLQKQEALQLLKKKEKTENIIKKTKQNRQKKKQNKEDKNSDPNRPKRPPSSFFLFSKEARKSLQEERAGINTSTLNALVSLKWKELSEEDRQFWNGQASNAMDTYKKELEEYNKSLAAATASQEQKTE